MSALKCAGTVLATTAAAVSLGFALPDNALAASDARVWSKAWHGYADAACDGQFVSYGDHFYLNDNLKDDAGCTLTWEDEQGHAGYIHNSNGAGTTVHRNYDFPEGTYISFEVCIRNDGHTLSETCRYGTASA
ncbi:hypothetical protein [Streptomyces sp. NPDC051636]|uniref:hypothetical protein n=1 Tax=Streptomyces sp. NPDC051636 TaxID=3365663 RepID=UPI0037A54525